MFHEPPECDSVRCVIGVEECDQHIDIQKSAHQFLGRMFEPPAPSRRQLPSRARLVRIVFAKLIDQLVCDDFAARWKGSKAIDRLRLVH